MPHAPILSQFVSDAPSHRIAMLIDGDNAEAKLLARCLDEASKHGTVTIRRIYGDWTNPAMSRWREAANMHAFQTPHQLGFTTGKNATDTFLIIEAMDILHSGSVDGFCIVSSDSDFTGLAKRIREQGMFVMGIGRMTTPASFQRACEVFTFTEILSEHPKTAIMLARGVGSAPSALSDSGDDAPAKPDEISVPLVPTWKKTILKAIEMTSQDEWNKLEAVAHNIRKVDSSFDPRTYGKSKLLLLIRTAPSLFEVREERQDTDPPMHYIRAIVP